MLSEEEEMLTFKKIYNNMTIQKTLDFGTDGVIQLNDFL